jgi:hypothetical protein
MLLATEVLSSASDTASVLVVVSAAAVESVTSASEDSPHDIEEISCLCV